MTTDETRDDRVYGLIPAIYRLRDLELGSPLQELLSVIQDDLESLESDIGRLYDDMFIETCQGPLIDYFAELVAVHLPPLTPSQRDPDSEAAEWISRRHQVVNAIAARAAKGTLAGLERIAADATGWPVRAVEEAVHVAVTQSIRRPDPQRGRLLDVRDDAPLSGAAALPWRTASELPDVRRGDSALTNPVGPHPTTVTITVWRQEVVHLHRAPALCIDDDNRYTFDALGYDRALAVAPTPRRPGTPPAGDLDLPVDITRRRLRRDLADYYGTDRSICIYRGRTPISREEIEVADLSDWAVEPDYGHVGLDPETGRIAFPLSEEPEEGVWVRYHYLDVGSVGAGGGGDDVALPDDPKLLKVFEVAVDSADTDVYGSVTAAIADWMNAARTDGRTHGVIRILDSSVYEEDFDIRVGPGMRLNIEAAAGQFPVLRSVDEQRNRPKRIRVEGYSVTDQTVPAKLSLSGITIAEHALELRGEFAEVTIAHCTIVPEREDANQRHVAIAVAAIPCPIVITSSIVGEIRVNTAEVGHDPVALSITDSIIDAGPDGGRAIGGVEDRPGYTALKLKQCTVIGEINVFHGCAQDSIITGRFFSRLRQTGEIRFCYLPPTSHVPRRVGCQPDGVLGRIHDDLQDGRIDAETAQARMISEPARVRPRFDSTDFSAPGYCRLSLDSAAEITHGSQDDGELGAFHDLWLTRRIDDMRTRLAEFTPVGVDLDIVFAT